MSITEDQTQDVLSRRQFFLRHAVPAAAAATTIAVLGAAAATPAAAQYRSRPSRGNRRYNAPRRRPGSHGPARRNSRVDLYDWKQGMRDRMRNCVRRGTC